MQGEVEELLNLAAESLSFSGYQDTEGQKEQAEAENRFKSAINRIAYITLREEPNGADAVTRINELFDRIETEWGEGWSATIDYTRERLVRRIESESRKKPWVRKAVWWTPAAAAAVVAIAYFGAAYLWTAKIDQPLETRAGLVQRAQAFEKTLFYDQRMSDVLRRRWFAEILLWPTQPSTEEAAAANEFAGLILGGREALLQQQVRCPALPLDRQGRLTEATFVTVSQVAERIQRPDFEWQQPATNALVEPIAQAFDCK